LIGFLVRLPAANNPWWWRQEHGIVRRHRLAILGGPNDNNALGAAWIFTRNGGLWTQQGPKLVGTGAVGAPAHQGHSVALSRDGTTAIVGGPNDNFGAGAAWVFTYRGNLWVQQGGKLVGTGAEGTANQGWSVALSGDGNTAIVGGPYDTQLLGAAWVYTRNVGVWSQHGPKLVGTGAVGNANQSWTALSSDGNTAMLGGNSDNSNIGAAWFFVQPMVATPASPPRPFSRGRSPTAPPQLTTKGTQPLRR
jgi:hypothetical protein